MINRWTLLAYSIVLVLCGFVLGNAFGPQAKAHAQAAARVYELRTYTAPDGKLGDLHARFRNHTLRIFQRLGMTNVVYLSPVDAPLKDNTLMYLLSYPSREAAQKSWSEFRVDPEWKKVASESQVNGPITSKVESVFLVPTDYSPMK
ncbi:MAG: NIPSNAP family protein [Vicinamibacterales bacterium]